MGLNLDQLQQRLNYSFANPALAKQALTHRSSSTDHNERLEFLGDALLGVIVAETLYQRFPDAAEGDLSRLRASIVNKKTLADIARQYELGSQLQLSSGESKSGGKRRDSILADAVEALIAAVYLDGGQLACKQLVLHLCASSLQDISPESGQKDAKTRLQELMQSFKQPLPVYTVVAVRGEEHNQTFEVECKINGSDKVRDQTAAGNGKSKRSAEQRAAQAILASLGEND